MSLRSTTRWFPQFISSGGSFDQQIDFLEDRLASHMRKDARVARVSLVVAWPGQLLAQEVRNEAASEFCRATSQRPEGSLAEFRSRSGNKTLWGVGKFTHDARAAKTGQMAAEALFHTELAVRGLKTVFNRERPNKIDGQGQFWGGGRSFPSGHAATSFAFATVVADQYKNKPLIRVGAYGLATAVSLSRVGGLNHFPSDVLIGAAVGHLIGRFILQRHKDN